MANWLHTLKIKDEWQSAKNDEISHHELARCISNKLQMIRNKMSDHDFTLDELIDEFDGIAQDKEADVDEFDDVMQRLYDWGDQTLPPYNAWPHNKMCWIATM